MLELRPNCECCDRDLLPEASGAWICSFECTFCEACARNVLAGTCPNCGGELVTRPRRARKLWPVAPVPSAERRALASSRPGVV